MTNDLEESDREAMARAEQHRLWSLEMDLRFHRELHGLLLPLILAQQATLDALLHRIQPDETDRRMIANLANEALSKPPAPPLLAGYKKAWQQQLQRKAREEIARLCGVPARRKRPRPQR